MKLGPCHHRATALHKGFREVGIARLQEGNKLYLFLRQNSLRSPDRSTAEGIENGDLDGDLFPILVAD